MSQNAKKHTHKSLTLINRILDNSGPLKWLMQETKKQLQMLQMCITIFIFLIYFMWQYRKSVNNNSLLLPLNHLQVLLCFRKCLTEEVIESKACCVVVSLFGYTYLTTPDAAGEPTLLLRLFLKKKLLATFPSTQVCTISSKRLQLLHPCHTKFLQDITHFLFSSFTMQHRTRSCVFSSQVVV